MTPQEIDALLDGRDPAVWGAVGRRLAELDEYAQMMRRPGLLTPAE